MSTIDAAIMGGFREYSGRLVVFACAAAVAVFAARSRPGYVSMQPPAVDPPPARFGAEVIPILERRCGISCHAIPQARYRAWMDDPAHSMALYIPVDETTGEVSDDPRLRAILHDVVRGKWQPNGKPSGEHAAGHGRIDYAAAARFSPLLRDPLAETYGGSPHRGRDVFHSTDDPDYRTLEAWVQDEIDAHPEAAPPTTAAEDYFASEVLGVLERNGCFLQSCHGGYVFNDLKMESPLPANPSTPSDAATRMSPRMLAKLRRAVLGNVTRLVNLGGDVTRSRVLVKNLPIEAGGVHQRGGNVQFFEDLEDPDAQTLVLWMEMEKAVLEAKLTSGGAPIRQGALGREQGIAFLRGPRSTPRRFFDFDTFWPGTRLLVLPAGTEQTVALVDEPDVELQAFDVRYDARAIVLSMRTGPDIGFRLYQLMLGDDLEVAQGSLQPISFAPARRPDGSLIHHIDPVYIPERSSTKDPSLDHALDRVAIAFASNAAGGFATSDAFALLGEADGGDVHTLRDAQRVEAPGSLEARRLHILDGPMRGQWRRITAHLPGGKLRLDRALPQPPDLTTVYAIEKPDAHYRPGFDIWRMEPSADFEQSARRMSWTNAQERRPTVRTTGEVMFTSVRNRGYQLDRPVYNGAIYRVQAGGWDYHIQGGNRSRHPLYVDSRELPSGLEIRMATDPRNLWGGGAPMLADHGFGVNIEPDNPVDALAFTAGDSFAPSSSQRFLPAQVAMFPERGDAAVHTTGLSPGGSFRDPFPQMDGTIFIAHASGPIDHLSASADPDWDLYRLRFEDSRLQSADGRGPGRPLLDRIAPASTAEWAEYSPRPLTVRLKERSVTHQKFATRSDDRRPTVHDGVLRHPRGTPGQIECYDFPLLQSFLGNFTPAGERDFNEDRVRHVRIVQQLPRELSDTRAVEPPGPDADPFATRIGLGVHDRQRIVAEVPLEPDGSFYAEVPTEVPLIMQALDDNRMAYLSLNRWFYLQPGEKLTFSIPRSVFPTRCTGCHGALTGDKADALGPPDLVSAASMVMATWDPQDSVRRPPFRDTPVDIDFRRDVQPILDRKCMGCHGGAHDETGLLDLRGEADGAFSTAYRSLHQLRQPGSGNHADKRYVNEREALSGESPLMHKLTGRTPDERGRLRATAEPHPLDTPLDETELLTLSRWIDLGASFLGGGS